MVTSILAPARALSSTRPDGIVYMCLRIIVRHELVVCMLPIFSIQFTLPVHVPSSRAESVLFILVAAWLLILFLF